MKRLVVTADDVGLDPGITRGALLARAEGIVTSLSVLTARPDWETTAEALREAGAGGGGGPPPPGGRPPAGAIRTIFSNPTNPRQHSHSLQPGSNPQF